jgi:hypothetical protein
MDFKMWTSDTPRRKYLELLRNMESDGIEWHGGGLPTAYDERSYALYVNNGQLTRLGNIFYDSEDEARSYFDKDGDGCVEITVDDYLSGTWQTQPSFNMEEWIQLLEGGVDGE